MLLCQRVRQDVIVCLSGEGGDEVFVGYDRKSTPVPVPYPSACSPQAWAAGTPLLFLRLLLGLEPDGDSLRVDPAVPAEIGHLALRAIPGRWRRTDASTG